MRSLTTASISAGLSPAGSAEVETNALGAGLGGEVALERDPDDLLVETEQEQDLRCRRQQRDDAHSAIMAR